MHIQRKNWFYLGSKFSDFSYFIYDLFWSFICQYTSDDIVLIFSWSCFLNSTLLIFYLKTQWFLSVDCSIGCSLWIFILPKNNFELELYLYRIFCEIIFMTLFDLKNSCLYPRWNFNIPFPVFVSLYILNNSPDAFVDVNTLQYSS